MADSIAQEITSLSLNDTANDDIFPTPTALSTHLDAQTSPVTNLRIRLAPKPDRGDHDSMAEAGHEFDAELKLYLQEILRVTGPEGTLEKMTLVVDGTLGDLQWTPLRRFLNRVSAQMARARATGAGGKRAIRLEGVVDSGGYSEGGAAGERVWCGV